MTTDPLQTAAQIMRLAGSGLFDADWYLTQYPDTPGDPLVDFCNYGWLRGRRPNICFDAAFYLERCEDVRLAGLNPLYHYFEYGEAEGRSPCADFDPVDYRAQYRPEGSCLADYLARLRAAPARPPPVTLVAPADEHAQLLQSGLFDVNYYLIDYPDVRASNLQPLEHFVQYGWREGRRPNPYFDPSWYCGTYLAGDPDLNPLLDYIRTGEQAGRRPIIYFDPTWYRARHQLGAAASPLRHFLEHRRSQIFSPNPWFDAGWYMRQYGGEVGFNRDPFAHYLRVGITHDVDPGPGFSAKSYRTSSMPVRPARANPAAGAEVHERLRREGLNPLVHFLLHEDTAQSARAAE